MEFLDKYFEFKNNICINGLTGELNVFYVDRLFKNKDKSILIVTSTLYEANQFYENLKKINANAFLFPMDDFLTSVALAVSPELKIKRLETLEAIKKNNKAIIVTNLMGYLKFLPPYHEKEFVVSVNENINRTGLENYLEQKGFKKETLVTTTGEYALRGFIIDIFIPLLNNPVRIELFGDQVESIRYFDIQTQRSLEKINKVTISSFGENINEENASSLYDYLNNPIVVYIDYDQILSNNLQLEEEIILYKKKEALNLDHKFMHEFSKIIPKNQILLNSFSNNSFGNETFSYNAKNIINFNGDFQLLEKVVKKHLNKKKVIFYLSKSEQINKITNIFKDNVFLTNESNIKKNAINIINREINHGFLFEDLVIISENDIEEVKTKKTVYRNNFKIGRKIKDYAELNPGDYVVHYTYGIGLYNGVVTLCKKGLKKDYLQILYKDEDKIYVPVEKIDSIYKYASEEGKKPKINSLNSKNWQKTKQNLKNKIKDISEELLKLYAKRSQIKSPKFKDYPEEDLFAADFLYDETEDQIRAINDIFNDLKSDIPMDRLLCGDVGFGKTEVAFRGIFKTILNGYQVAYLCPTTILSRQQFELAKNRFEKYGVNVALLNRFISASKQKEIIQKIKDGKIDLVFGTHRILSDDIKFKSLGMLIVDEEQRFGVTHKEKIKKLKNNVNVLTLSATPIPRTLKLALSGLRDLSIIDTPPINRYPVQTYVVNENDLLIKDAIYKELARKGQVFILYNKVASIESKVKMINKLVPEARIIFAHGQMNKNDLEKIMDDFINYKYDVLICTTIIETGIDIQNVNTLIIYDADCFGLSQLYQLRGRVGRSDKIAYAYLLYNKNKILNEIAIKRLKAISEFTELGSGYKIAMRDIAIRGSGDILGSEQAGFVDSVGLELYMKMIDVELKKQRGDEVEENEEDNSLIDVATHISDDYINDESIKIEIHKLINTIKDYKSLMEIKQEIEDRFGKINNDMLVYMYEEWFEKLATRLKIEQITQNDIFIQIVIPKALSSTIPGDKLLLIANNINPYFNIKYFNNSFFIKLYYKNCEKHFIFYITKLLDELFPGK